MSKQQSEPEKEQIFDTLFMQTLKESNGIDSFFERLFSFMRRKTDFYTLQEKSIETVNIIMKKHLELFRNDRARQEAIAEKQAKYKEWQDIPKSADKPAAAKPAAVKKEPAGASIEEIDNEEARKIDDKKAVKKYCDEEAAKKLLQELPKNQPKKEVEITDKLDKYGKQKPNSGGGGQTDKYVWHQTLEEVTAYVPLSAGMKAKELKISQTMNNLKIEVAATKEIILEGKWGKPIIVDDSFWTINRDGQNSTLMLTLCKKEFEGEWWPCLLQGDIEIDITKVNPGHSKLSDLDSDHRQTVEKMMVDKQKIDGGKPVQDTEGNQKKLNEYLKKYPQYDTRDQDEKDLFDNATYHKDRLAQFYKDHPDVDFSKVKFN